MADEQYYVDNDLDFTVECRRSGATTDISDTSTRRIYYQKPITQTTSYWDASLSGTHQLTYSADSSDIDEAGVWLLYAYVVYNSGAIYKGNTVQLEIKKTWQI